MTLGSNVTVGGLTFNTHGYIIDPGTGPFGINFGTLGEINVSAGTTTIRAVISGSAIEKTGSGILRLEGAHTFNGLVMNGGTVTVGTNGTDTLGAAGSLITVESNSTLANGASGAISFDKRLDVKSGATLSLTNGNSGFTFQGIVSGSGTIAVNDAGSINQRTLNLSNTANTFTGAISLANNQSTIAVGSLGDAVGSGNIIFGANANRNGAFQLGTTAVAPLELDNRRIEIIPGASTNGTAQIYNTTTASSNANTLTINSDLLVTGTGGTKTLELRGSNTGNNTFAGVIANGGLNTLNLTKNNAGNWIVSGANTYNGNTTISAGNLTIGGAGTLGNVSTGVGNYSGNIAIASNNSGRLAYNSTTTQTLGGVISGAGQLHVEHGTLILTGDNSYTGNTLVNAGSLIINGSTGGSTVSVASGATLGGSGTVGGATTVNGFLTPGNSPGIIEFAAGLTLGSTSTTTIEILGLSRGSQFDGVDVTGGTLTYGGALVYDFQTVFGVGSHSFNLFDVISPATSTGEFASITLTGDYSGAFSNSGGGIWTASINSGDQNWQFNHNDGNLSLIVIPEPTTALLGSLGMLALVRRRR